MSDGEADPVVRLSGSNKSHGGGAVNEAVTALDAPDGEAGDDTPT